MTLDLGDMVRTRGGKKRLDFSFGYFQNLQDDLILPEGFAPARVSVKLTQQGASAKSVEKSFDWSIEAG